MLNIVGTFSKSSFYIIIVCFSFLITRYFTSNSHPDYLLCHERGGFHIMQMSISFAYTSLSPAVVWSVKLGAEREATRGLSVS